MPVEINTVLNGSYFYSSNLVYCPIFGNIRNSLYICIYIYFISPLTLSTTTLLSFSTAFSLVACPLIHQCLEIKVALNGDYILPIRTIWYIVQFISFFDQPTKFDNVGDHYDVHILVCKQRLYTCLICNCHSNIWTQTVHKFVRNFFFIVKQ